LVTIEQGAIHDGLTVTIGLVRRAPTERALAEIVLCLAGPVAEMISARTDALPHGAESDLRDALLWILRVGADLPEMLAATRRVLLRHWQAIERLAGVLLDERMLTGTEVRRVVGG
jgi:hypothetical protein